MSPEEMMEKDSAHYLSEQARKERLELDARERADAERQTALRISILIGAVIVSFLVWMFHGIDESQRRKHDVEMKKLEVELEKAKLDNQHPPLWRHK